MKKNYLNYLLLIVFCLFLLMITKDSSFLFGSTTDWWNQHVSFAEYFRNLFYETNDLFPNLALHLGAGENIFHFSYYGLFSPWLFLSYLFPNVSMASFIQIMNMLFYTLSVLLMYRFLIHKKISKENSLLAAVLFAAAAPLLFHFHRQIMFVDYMPILILGLFAVDLYFEKSRKVPLVLCVFFLILTSYYYSVTGLVVLAIYAIFTYYQRNLKLDKKEILKTFSPLVGTVLLGILLAAFLLLPTLYVLLHGRGEVVNNLPFIVLFLPNPSLETLLYSNYNIGLTAITLFLLLLSLFTKDKIRVLSILLFALLLFPIFPLLLNGGLYARGKILIPFLPLIIYVVAYMFEQWPRFSFSKKTYRLVGIITNIVVLICLFAHFLQTWFAIVILCDLVLLDVGLYFKVCKNYKMPLILGSLLVAVGVVLASNTDEEYVRYQNVFNKESLGITEAIQETLARDSSFYRFQNLYDPLNTMNRIYGSNYYTTSIYSSSENADYITFLRDVMKIEQEHSNLFAVTSSANLLFATLMNVKYIATTEEAPLGYEKVMEDDTVAIYRNQFTLPLGYASNRLYSQEAFDLLEYPNNLDTLFHSIVVDQDVLLDPNSNIQKIDASFQFLEHDFPIETIDDGYRFQVDYTEQFLMQLNQPLDSDQILLLSFDVNRDDGCSEDEGRSITIDGVTNQRSCDSWTYANKNERFHYVLSSQEAMQTFSVQVTKGAYELTNWQAYVMDYDKIKEFVTSVNPWNIDSTKTTQDSIEGTIEVVEDSYFATTIPYDKGYRVILDGQEIAYEKVNTAFLGFPITKGSHTIRIEYESPFFQIGKSISIIALVLLGGMILQEGYQTSRKMRSKK